MDTAAAASLPTIPVSQLSGLASIATSGNASNLSGVLATSNLPTIPVSQLSGLASIATSGNASNLSGVLSMLNLPTIPVSQLSGLASIASSGNASNLGGVLSTSNLPTFDASKIMTGSFNIGSFATSVMPSVGSSFDFGSSSNSWRSVYLASNLSAGSVTAPSIASSNGSFSGSLTVYGDLTVGGILKYITTNDLLVADKNVTLAYAAMPTDSGASGAGLYVCGSNYAAANSRLSLTWNTGGNGNYWAINGGKLALSGATGGSNVVLANSNGALCLSLDNGINPTSTPMWASSMIPLTSNINVGAVNNYWGNMYTASLQATSITEGNTNAITAYLDWAPWTPSGTTSNVTLQVSTGRYCTINKRCSVQYSIRMTLLAASSNVALTLPLSVATSTVATQAYTKLAGSNTNTNTNFALNNMITSGTSVGTVQTDSTTSKLILSLVNFLPGTWTAVGQLTYESQ
jgi:hypothetical protein